MNTVPVLTEKNVLKLGNSLKKRIRTRYLETGLPFVTLKFAQTLDGKIATTSSDSKWISSPASLEFTHRLRSIHDAILVGVDTIIQDDPQLTARLVKGRNPLK
ncbi:MAG TPA: RibD family protein, partial [candidate division Zixibacteria bacterium]